MTDFSGTKVLVVEDEGFVALMIEDMLEDLGCQVVASVPTLKQACMLAQVADIHLAVLDINLGGDRSFPAASILRERGIPFIFSTGYGADGLPAEFSGSPVLGKPFSAEELKEKLQAACAPP